MANEVKKYDFIDLVNLKNDELKENASIADITYTLISYIKKSDVPKDEILLRLISFVSEKLLTAFTLGSSLTELLDKLFPDLFDIFEIVIDSISRNQRTIEGSNILNFLSNLLIIFEKIQEENGLQLNDLRIFIEYGLKFLGKYFSLLKDFETQTDVSEENKENLNNILQQSFNLHSQILKVLNENFGLLVCRTGDGSSEIIIKFLTELLRTTRILVSFNIMACITTLKFLLKLSIANSTVFENQIEKNLKWLADFIKFLCEQIHSLLLQFYNEEFQKESLNDMTKYLKASAFFVQCMIKITEHFGAQNILGFHHIIPVFFEIYRLTASLNYDILNLIEQYLTINILSLIRTVYRTEDFIGEYLKKSHNAKDDLGFCVIGLEIMNCLAFEKDEYDFSVYFYGQFFEVFFSKIPNCPDIFLLQENYQKLEAAVISLWLVHNENIDVIKTFEQILVKGILQHNLLLSKICFDIWMFLARAVDNISCHHYFKFWSEINESLPINCYDPKIIQIEYLVRIFYSCLPKTYKVNVWTDESSIEKSRLIFTLGINNIVNESKKLAFKYRVEGKLVQNLKLIVEKHNFEPQIYMDLMKLLKLLSGCKFTNKHITRLIIILIKRISFETNFQRHELFINVLIEFLLKNFDNFNETEKRIVWEKIEDIKKKSNLSTKLHISKFKQYVTHPNILTFGNITVESTDQLLERFVDMEITFERGKFELMKQLKAIKTPHLPLIWECNQFLGYTEFSNSEEYKNETTPQIKKIKLTDLKEIRDYELVRSTLETARQISNYFEHNTISSSDLNAVKETIKLLNGVVNIKVQ